MAYPINMKPENKFTQLSWHTNVSRVNATGNVSFGATNAVVLNPWNVINNISVGDFSS